MPFAVACGDVSEDVGRSDECVSGRKWTAGDVGHPEMHPGRNCVGCHVDHAGPPLALGGTVYAVRGQVDDCYGVEGAVVEITAGDGQVISLETNAAGNFYLEGDPSTLVKPYTVRLLGWNFDGTEAPPHIMPVPAETGDCRHCHGTTAVSAEFPTRAFPAPFNISLKHNLNDYKAVYGF